MIRSFADQATADVYVGQESKAARRIPKQIWPVVRRKLDVLHRARSAHDLRYPSAGHTGPMTIRSPKPSSRTLKYCPQFPDRFGSIEDGRAFCHSFFRWYNHDHHHSGLGFLEPAIVHFGHAAAVRAHRDVVLAAAYGAHPERFVNGPPRPADLPTAVWINPPVNKPARQDGPGTTIVLSDDQRVAPLDERNDDGPLVMIDRNAT